MKRIALSAALAVSFLLAASTGLAQVNPAIGTWKLNPEKSKATSMTMPKSMTRTSEAAGDGMKVSYQGEAADGTAMAFGFTFNYDGKDNPVTGSGQPFNADSISVTRLNPRTAQSTLKKDGAVVGIAKTTLSVDGKALTIAYADAKGKPSGNTFFYDKQ